VPATAITASTRYFRPGLTKVTYLPACANIAAPTRAELNAGTDLSPEIASVDGWAVNAEFIDTPDLLNTFTGKLAARTSSDTSSLNMYSSSNSVDVRSLLPRGTTGFIVWFDENDIAGRKMDVFPVTVASAPKQRDLEAAAQIQIVFAITRQPSENVTVPA